MKTEKNYWFRTKFDWSWARGLVLIVRAVVVLLVRNCIFMITLPCCWHTSQFYKTSQWPSQCTCFDGIWHQLLFLVTFLAQLTQRAIWAIVIICPFVKLHTFDISSKTIQTILTKPDLEGSLDGCLLKKYVRHSESLRQVGDRYFHLQIIWLLWLKIEKSTFDITWLWNKWTDNWCYYNQTWHEGCLDTPFLKLFLTALPSIKDGRH